MDPLRLQRGGRKPAVSQAREAIAYLCTDVAGHPGRALAPLLGVRPVSVYAAARPRLAERGRWDALMEHRYVPLTTHPALGSHPTRY